MKLTDQLKKIASEIKNNEALLVDEDIKNAKLLKKFATVKMLTYKLFIPTTKR